MLYLLPFKGPDPPDVQSAGKASRAVANRLPTASLRGTWTVLARRANGEVEPLAPAFGGVDVTGVSPVAGYFLVAIADRDDEAAVRSVVGEVAGS